MNTRTVNNILESLRWIIVGIGIFLTFLLGENPVMRLHILEPFLVIPISGLTGVEALFFSKAASEISGYAPGPYQRQSGMNNLALSISSVLSLILQWGTYAEAALLSTMLIFLTLSAGNHTFSAFKEGNMNKRNIMRPVMTALLLAYSVPLMVQALVYIKGLPVH